MNRAYSLLTIKAVNEEKRVITGIASTPTVDRMGDIIDPMGAIFKTPMPLLLGHDSGQVVGTVDFARPTKNGISFSASLPNVKEDGDLKRLVDKAWHSIKYKLLAAVSIGFRAAEGGVERLKGGGLLFNSWEWLELSLVAIPAQPEAVIQSFKSMDPDQIRASLSIKALDLEALAASGRETSRGSGPDSPAGVTARRLTNHGREAKAMNVQEEIRNLESQHAGATAKQTAIMAKAKGEGRTLDADEQSTFDDLTADVAAYTKEIRNYRVLESQAIPRAVAVAGGSSEQAMSVRQGVSITAGRSVVPKGIPFIRYAMALANGRGSVSDALLFAQRWKDSTPEVLQALRVKADVGTTTDADWALPLATPQTLASEFIDLLRPMTFLGKLTLRNVPFNVKIVRQTAGSTIAWVGETLPKPVGQLAFDSITMGVTKVAGIVVISDELAKLSTPSAEALVRADMLKQVAQYLDEQFIDPSVTASAGVRPASITNGAATVPASGNDAAALRCDLASLVGLFTAANQSLAGTALLMSETIASGLAFSVNALGQPEFPSLSATGGSVNGVTVVTSGNLPGDSSGSIIVLLKQDEIYLADEGGVNIDVSREATLDLSGGATAAHNLWQHNEVGFRAERMINWQKARASSVAYITDAAYGACGT